MKPTDKDDKAAAAKEPMMSCTILVAKTVVRGMQRGFNSRVHLPESEAKALAGLSPPKVRIDGLAPKDAK